MHCACVGVCMSKSIELAHKQLVSYISHREDKKLTINANACSAVT